MCRRNINRVLLNSLD